MGRSTRFWAFVGMQTVLLGAMAAPGAGAEPLTLSPSSEWALDSGGARCRLWRVFGTGGDRTLLYFEQYTPSKHLRLTIAGRPMRPFVRGSDVNLRFGPQEEVGRKVSFGRGTFEGYGDTIFVSRLSPGRPDEDVGYEGNYRTDDPAVEGLPHIATDDVAHVEWLSVSRPRDTLVLQLPHLSEAFSTLDACAKDLLASWNLDPERHQTMSRKAEPVNIAEVAAQVASSYPADAVRAGEEADAVMRIIVEADGTISECYIAEATVANYLKSPACDVFGDRAMFAPALDAQGQPMKSYYTATLTYRLR